MNPPYEMSVYRITQMDNNLLIRLVHIHVTYTLLLGIFVLLTTGISFNKPLDHLLLHV